MIVNTFPDQSIPNFTGQGLRIFQCRKRYNKKIKKECRVGIYIPSAFTPNHDGKNDIFKPIAFGPISDYLFTIYNRFGEIVFSAVDVNKGWDSRFKSIAQNNNTFLWTCKYRLNGGELTMQKGTVTIIK